jgi:DNA mismatch repair protein MutS
MAAVETPLMKQYNAIKTKYPGAILLFRVGDFYETFGEDAVKVSEILGIVLTKRGNGSATEIELAGFPHHSLDNYLPKLVRAGQRVAVCDQLEDPKQAKGIVKRGVTELVTPGVALNDKILESRESNYLSAVHFANAREAGVAFVEASTGDFFCFSGPLTEVEQLLNTLKPAEVLVPRKDLRHFHQHFGDKFYVTRQEDWIFQFDYAYESLTALFGTKSLKGFGVEKAVDAVTAAGAALHYLKDNQQANLGHITRIYLHDNSSHVWLDPFTIRNLELVHPLHPDGKALIDVIDKTVTAMGARLLRRWAIFPLKDVKEIHRRHNTVETLIRDQENLRKLDEILKKVSDLERLVSKLATQKMMPREAAMLRTSLQLVDPLLRVLRAFGSPAIDKICQEVEDVADPLHMLERILAEDPSNNLTTGGVINDGVSPDLDELRGIETNSKDLLLAMQQREIERTGITSLKIGFNKVFGYYLEVTHAHKDKVPDDFIRKQTLTNAERYITDELKTYEEKILNAEEKMVSIESEIYQQLIENLQPYLLSIQKNAGIIASMDVYASFAKAAQQFGYCKPEVGTEDVLDIRAGRHPVIERELTPEHPYVPNDVFLDNEAQQIIIITGPNMAGKSALLRQTALIVLMAQMGSYVPADSAKVGLVDKVFVRVGASDNISSGESTFMVEMNEAARIINNATRKSLILLDEIGRGTSTYDGVSIAWALVEYLHETKRAAAKTLFATHYHELNEIASRMERVRNYNVSVKELDGRILFMRKLLPGGSEHSFGIHVAEMAGMPRSIIDRANELLVHFEQNKVKDKNAAKAVKFAAPAASLQLNMFELKDADTLKIRQVLAGVDIDRMTPVEALLKLQEIKRALVD